MDNEDIKIQHSDNWTGEYREIGFAIHYWGISDYNPHGIWNYYLFVPLERLPEECRGVWYQYPKVCSERSNRQPIMYRPYSDLPDLELHGGCTFYHVIEDDGNAPVGKVGCDYNHAWDQGNNYSEQCLLHDVKRSIDMLWQIYPTMKHQCWYCHGYHPQEEGHLTDRGWITFECEEKVKP